MDVQFNDFIPEDTQIMYVPVFKGGVLGEEGEAFLESVAEQYGVDFEDLTSFDGERGKKSSVKELPGGFFVEFVGMGEPESLNTQELHKVAAAIERSATYHGTTHISFLGDTVDGLNMDSEDLTAQMADILNARNYKFEEYKTGLEDAPAKINFAGVVEYPEWAQDLYYGYESLTESVNWAKDLTNRGPEDIYPEKYAAEIKQKFANDPNVKVKILYAEEMEKQGMRGALAVGRASDKKPCVVVIEYDGTNGTQERPLGLVGKGVTFDTGGVNVKPGNSMGDMHMDMAGSAAVVGGIHALAAREAEVKVVGVVGLVENAIGPNSYKPMGTLKMMNGKTVEVTNTDAEGRLVLADMLTYIQQEYDSRVILDFATLTGAVVAALGHEYTGVFTNNKLLSTDLQKAGKEVGENTWHLPHATTAFTNALNSRRADMLNCSLGGIGGASTAANFLSRFIEKTKDGFERAWAHLDIAGSAIPPGGLASGVGVRLIDRFVRNNYEKKPAPVPQITEDLQPGA